jgi:AraC-like DNA-binding protein
MKAFLEQVPLCQGSSFLVREFNVPYFEAPLHFHPVYELTLITESRGKRFIGDHIGDFDVGDLVFMGPNLPHLYRCTNEYYQNNPEHRARAIIIQHTEDFLGKDFFSIPEMTQVKTLLDNSMRGLAYYGKTRKEIINRLKKITDADGIEKLTQFLTILDIMGRSTEYELLARQNILGQNIKDNVRMNKIYEYVMANFTNRINVRDVADQANMSEAAFCRYFKKKTRKTFVSFLNEVKIGYASKLLLEEDLNVTQVCYESGFENISNFNRQFKTITKVTPLKYKQQFKKQPPSTTEYLTM